MAWNPEKPLVDMTSRTKWACHGTCLKEFEDTSLTQCPECGGDGGLLTIMAEIVVTPEQG